MMSVLSGADENLLLHRPRGGPDKELHSRDLKKAQGWKDTAKNRDGNTLKVLGTGRKNTVVRMKSRHCEVQE